MPLPFISLFCSFISGQFIFRRFISKSQLVFVMFEGSGQICVQYAEGGNSDAVISVLLPQAPLWKLSLSCSTEVSGATAGQRCRCSMPGVGTGTQSLPGCRLVCKSWVTSFLLSGTLVAVPAGERVNRESSSHTHIIVGLCSCPFLALGAFLHGHLAGELPVWCQRQVQASGTELAWTEQQDNCVFQWEQESGKGFLCISMYPLIKRLSNC